MADIRAWTRKATDCGMRRVHSKGKKRANGQGRKSRAARMTGRVCGARQRGFLALLVALVMGSCSRGPSQPSPPILATPDPVVRISGLDRYTLQPGLTIQLTARLERGGTSEDCTTTAVWTSSNALLRTGRQPGEFVVDGTGDGAVSATCATVVGRATVHVEEPTSWPVAGVVSAAPHGAPVAGATLALDGYAPVQADDAGRYKLKVEDRNVHRLLVSAPGFLLREAFLRGGELRDLDIDLIGKEPGFPLTLYRQMARNTYEQPDGTPFGIRRWTTNPNIYFQTTWRNAPDNAVGNIQWFADEFRRVIPLLTAGQLQAGAIEFGPGARPAAQGWINVQFDSSLTASGAPVADNPGRVTFNFDDACRYYVVMHEVGHAIGYWHTNVVPSLMGNAPRFCTPFALSAEEQLVVRTMYSRPPGNLEPDRDPSGSALLHGAGVDNATIDPSSCPE